MAIADLLTAETRGKPGASNVWLTPRYILEALGPFDLDPASCPGWPTADRHFYEADNGLYQEWTGLVWLNPPYGNQTADWVERWVLHGNGFLLVAARPDARWFHQAAKHAGLIWFPKKRINFLKPGNDDDAIRPAFASVVFAMGAEPIRRLERMGELLWRRYSAQAKPATSGGSDG